MGWESVRVRGAGVDEEVAPAEAGGGFRVQPNGGLETYGLEEGLKSVVDRCGEENDDGPCGGRR